MTCHLKESYDDEGKLLAAKPDLNNRCLKVVNGLADVIAVITQSWNEKGESERWVQTRSTPAITAGSRFRFLRERIPFSFKDFEEAIAEAIDKEGIENGLITDEAPVYVEEKLDYKALMDEAKSIWTTILERGKTEEEKQTLARDMLKKVEMEFGQKLKLSEITEDQVSVLNLVVMDLREML